jgi:ATPase subunit of ABC transporter with duplicated ATPase domains
MVGEDPLECEIEIMARPRGKNLQSILLLSGGERALTAIALLFAIYLVKPSPFCILDEVDAPLDDANVDRFVNMLQRFSARTQFIVVTHNKKTMEIAEGIYGVTMQEPGVSKLVSVRFASPREGAEEEPSGNGHGQAEEAAAGERGVAEPVAAGTPVAGGASAERAAVRVRRARRAPAGHHAEAKAEPEPAPKAAEPPAEAPEPATLEPALASTNGDGDST